MDYPVSIFFTGTVAGSLLGALPATEHVCEFLVLADLFAVRATSRASQADLGWLPEQVAYLERRREELNEGGYTL